MTEERYSMKDDFFNPDTVKLVTDSIARVWPEFDEDKCLKAMIRGLDGLALKERMNHLAMCLETYLSDDYKKNVDILTKALATLDQGHFVFASFCDYLAANGCNDAYVDLSLNSLGTFTKYFSGEFAVRRFINTYPEKTYEAMMAWSLSDDADQRRFASEGLRPKLPWAKGIEFDYKRGIHPLDNLYMDSNRYVTRSVANHLNDISKMNPDLVMTTLKRWKKEGKQTSGEMQYIIAHSTRTLVKQGYQPALELLGYKNNPNLLIENFKVLRPSLSIGESLEFTFDLTVKEDVNLMVDYIIDYPMANGKRSTKVFKLKKIKMKQEERLAMKKKHPFKVMTTKKLYSGDYRVILQINGKQYDVGEFCLSMNETFSPL